MYFYNNYASSRYHARIARDWSQNYWNSANPSSYAVAEAGFGLDVAAAYSASYTETQLTVGDGSAATVTTDASQAFNWHVAAPTGGGSDTIDLGFTLVSPAAGGATTTASWIPSGATSYVAADVVEDDYFVLAFDAEREVYTVRINYASRNRREWKIGFTTASGSGISGLSTITVCVNLASVQTMTYSHDVAFMNPSPAVNFAWKETSIRAPDTNAWTKYDECKV
jgi:hypothetical protein